MESLKSLYTSTRLSVKETFPSGYVFLRRVGAVVGTLTRPVRAATTAGYGLLCHPSTGMAVLKTSALTNAGCFFTTATCAFLYGSLTGPQEDEEFDDVMFKGMSSFLPSFAAACVLTPLPAWFLPNHILTNMWVAVTMGFLSFYNLVCGAYFGLVLSWC
eukprot:GFYU01013965.1.p1 GENE.GFYU01013965.1~~GFYU01013965.1.p1  ORF type:complete len:159 (-),score=19.67 GFYU01013965.1:197-673(-)